MKKLHYLTAWFLLFTANQAVFSQFKDTINLETVVVTGELKPVSKDQSLYQIKSISAREIRGRGATSLSELLSNQLSFRVNQDASLGASLKMNGLDGEHVKILVDGIPIVGRQAGILDLSQISLFKVDHVEIIEGPMSVIYGSNALGGVINIITQRNVFGDKETIKVRSYYETVGVYNFDANVLLNRNNHFFSLSAGRHFFGGTAAPGDSFRYKTWKPKLQWNGEGNYTYRNKKIQLNLGTSLFKEELRNKGNPEDKPTKAKDQYYYTNRNLFKMDFTTPVNKSLSTTLLASYSYYRKEKVTMLKDLVTLDQTILQDSSAQDTTSFDNIMGRWMLGGKIGNKLEMQSGLEYNQEDGKGKRIGGNRSITEAAGFLSFKYDFGKPLSIQSGIRFLHNSNFKAPLIYNINALIKPMDKLQIRCSYGKGFRAPSLKELYYEFIDINHYVLGNDSLKAEKSSFLGLNTDFTFNPNLEMHFNLFQNIVDNKIEFLYDSQDATKAQYFNLPGKQTYVRGFKLSFEYNWNKKLDLETGYQINGQSKINSNQYTWTHDLTVSGSYHFEKLKSKISIFYKYNGKYTFYTADYNENQEIEKINENFLDRYHTMDVILSKWLFDEKIEIATGIKNVFDNKNVLGKGSSGVHSGGDAGGNTPVGWGRTMFLQFQFNLNHDRKNSDL